MKIFLIGMMGAGKTYWAQRAARRLKTGAYDLDNLVEALEEKSIADMFAEDGEAYFRKAEAKLLRLFGEKKAFVLATGGGTPCFHGNMEWMNAQGVTVWIDEPVEVLVERLLPEQAHRPLLKDFDREQLGRFLESKLAERRSFYAQAQHRLAGHELTEATFAKMLKQHA